MYQFEPSRVLFEERALEYPLGARLWERFQDEQREIRLIPSHNRVTGLPGISDAEKFREAKKTLVVGIRRTKELASCRPSADYQLVLSTSCPGMCEYCYLHTTLGRRPVVRLYVNIDEILAEAARVIKNRRPQFTAFEGAATSDPLPLEPYSGALSQAIEFFAEQEFGRFRFVTKFTEVEPLLSLKHNNHTEIRFSINNEEIIRKYEHHTPRLKERLQAAAKVAAAGYPFGFLIAPLFFTPDWQKSYTELFTSISAYLPRNAAPTFELITHRFTSRGKANINAVFPASDLPLDAEGRRFKFGQFGYGKYLYAKEEMDLAKEFFGELIPRCFPEGKLLYFV